MPLKKDIVFNDLEKLIVITLDRNGCITEINDRGCELLGRDRNELLGMDWFKNFLPNNIRNEMWHVFDDLISGKRAPVKYYENSIIAKNGEERLIAWNNTVLKDDNGEIIGLLDSGLDITEHIKTKRDLKKKEKRLVEALRESKKHEKEILALLKGTRAVLEYDNFEDTAKKIFDCCKELIGAGTGYMAILNKEGNENQILFMETGKRPCRIVSKRPMPIRGLREEACRKIKALYENNFFENEWSKLLPEGHVPLRNVMFSPLIIDDQVMGIMGLANKDGDFNEEDTKFAMAFGELLAIALKNQQQIEMLENQRNELSSYSHNISHEIKNYITFLEGYLEMFVNKEIDKNEFLQKYTHVIEKMKEFVSSQLSLAEAGKRVGDLVEIDLNMMVDNLKNDFAIDIIHEDLGCILADPQRIESIFINLIKNSIQHGDASVIKIESEEGLKGKTIRFIDNGRGLDPSELDKIFNLGYSMNGTGYGLYIVKSIVESLGGKVKASSEPGQGFELDISF